MTYSTKELAKLNNARRKRLTKENEQYYDGLLLYLRAHSLKNERATEEVLLEMLDHLLDAQEEGRSAYEVFGKEPKQLADEITKNLPAEPKSVTVLFTIEMIAIFLSCLLVTRGLMYIIQGTEDVFHIGNAAIFLGVSLSSSAVIILLLLKMVKQEAFGDAKLRKLTKIKYGVLVMFFIALVVGVAFLPATGPEVKAPSYLSIGLGCMFILISYLLKRYRASH